LFAGATLDPQSNFYPRRNAETPENLKKSALFLENLPKQSQCFQMTFFFKFD